MSALQEADNLLCPSAQPDWKEAVAIGILGGSAVEPRLSYLTAPLPATPGLLALADPVMPTEVFRFAAPCMNHGCRHHRASACHLAEKVVSMLSPVVEALPPCTIRARCRWFQQEGREACRRCPQVVTDNVIPSAEMRRAADPDVVMR